MQRRSMIQERRTHRSEKAGEALLISTALVARRECEMRITAVGAAVHPDVRQGVRRIVLGCNG
jgi:hypothetical protein